MTIAREDARDVDGLAPAERSAVAGIRGLRWWVVVLVAAVLAVAGVAADLLRAGELGIFYTVLFPVGAILAAVWVRRGEMFATCVQPPLLLAMSVPVAIVATGSLPRAGGLTGIVLAVGGPMINGFPVMAITTAVCLAVAFVRSRLQPLGARADDDLGPPERPVRDRPDRDRDRPERDRPERDRGRPDRDRAERTDRDRDRPPRPADRRPSDRPDDRRRDDRRPADRPDERRPDERRPDERKDDRRGDAARPTGRPASRPGDRPAQPARRPSGRGPEPEGRPHGERAPDDPAREGFGPGVYRVPRPPQASRPGGRPAPDAPRRPGKRPAPPPPEDA